MSPRAERPLPVWPMVAVMIAVAAFQLYAFYPGVVTPDTVAQWSQALVGRFDEWHPPATAWLWSRLMPFGPGTAPVLVFDVALYWGGTGLLADALRRRGRVRSMVAVVLLAAMPIPLGQMGAILKDPLLAASCLVVAGLLLRYGEGPRWLPRVLGAALLVFATATRINAVFATVPLLVALMPVRWSGSLPRLVVAGAAAAVTLLTGSWLIDTVALHPHRSRPIFSLVNFDLAGIVARGRPDVYPGLDPAVAARMTALCYSPRQFNPTFAERCNVAEDGLRIRADAAGAAPVSIWLHAIRTAPLAWAAHRIAHVNWNWRFFVGCVPDDAVYAMTTENDYGIGFMPNRATRVIGTAARWLAWSPLGRPATWLAICTGLLLVAPHLPSRRFVTALALSALGYGGAYALVSVAPDLRYNLWTMLAGAIALIVATSELWEANIARRTLLLAILPFAGVIASEMLALLIVRCPL